MIFLVPCSNLVDFNALIAQACYAVQIYVGNSKAVNRSSVDFERQSEVLIPTIFLGLRTVAL